MEKKRLYFDMDGVIVDFVSALKLQSEETLKEYEGRLDEIDYCVGCDQGCLDGFANMDCPHITCLRNPAVGRERECEIKVTDKPETVLIAGGGIAGLEAAIILKQRGHNPILCEATDTLGGQFLTAGKAPRKAEMMWAVQGMAKKAEKLEKTLDNSMLLLVYCQSRFEWVWYPSTEKRDFSPPPTASP